MIEEKSANELANDCQRTYGRRPQSQLSVFQNLVEHLAALPVGRYLLKHDDKDGGFMFIYQEQEAGVRFRLVIRVRHANGFDPSSRRFHFSFEVFVDDHDQQGVEYCWNMFDVNSNHSEHE
ncbi:unnamed protein product [Nesidiocoris tenuis]|uniref:Little elongation complex subunit 2 C-terminal domain-containing protein n=1 Tax=Nesidiocoris tenuis TaxID=355587 RepID=A0A6H5GZN0_9HEMI|nr:unnamed protein product [Nesidiocoris tenuis]